MTKYGTVILGDGLLQLRTAGIDVFHEYSGEARAERARPVLKWAGGKQWLARIAPLLAPLGDIGRYYEPFVGGGAFFFGLNPRRATLSDANTELVETYRALRKHPEPVIKTLLGMSNDKHEFYDIRDQERRREWTRAARFIYLNRTCFNGLYRVNRKGAFNTPFGQYTNPTICDAPLLRKVAGRLRQAKLAAGDFESVVAHAVEGDFVYFDPPYITGHRDNGFLKYNSALFSWSDQKRLAECARDLAARGVHVLVSNADHPSVLRIYRGFSVLRLQRRSSIAGAIAARGIRTETLLSSYPVLAIANGKSHG